MVDRLEQVDTKLIQMALKGEGLYQGLIDGMWGPLTDRAYSSFLVRTRTIARWPEDTDEAIIDFFGEIGTNQKTITVPYPLRYTGTDPFKVVTRITCHKLVADSLISIFQDILAHYGSLRAVQENRMDLYAGCLNVRPMRNGTSWSRHSWGIAIDLDDIQNGNGVPWPGIATMPMEVIKIFEKHGWKSYAKTLGRDAMHMQCAI